VATAFLTALITGTGSLRITSNGWGVATWPVTADDGPGPTSAATAVLAAHGWQAGRWEQVSGGIKGGEWTANVARADEDG
jgi:hypothetical protein